jgi:hypothetical protein
VNAESNNEISDTEFYAAGFDWFAPDLAVGGRIRTDLVELLSCRFGIRRVIDLRAEDVDDVAVLGRCQVEHLHLPTPDTRAVSQEMLSRGVAWVREGFARYHKALIHCEYGIGRSVLLACCVLVSLGHTPSAAMRLAKRARSIASPSEEQLNALLTWSAEWHRRQHTPCPTCTWHDLAAIAYHHDASSEGTIS